MDLNNLYQEYAFNPEDFQTLSDIYTGVMANVMNYVSPLQDNRIARYMEDFRIVPVQYIDIRGAQYTPESFLSGDELAQYEQAETVDKIRILRGHQKYIQVIADRQFMEPGMMEGNVVDESLDETRNQIVNFDLCDPDRNDCPLIAGIHYYFANNQLFLLGDYAVPFDNKKSPFYQETSTRGTKLKMTNIAVDFNTVTDMLGKNLELEYQEDKIPKVEFNDFVRELTLSAVKGFQLCDVREGLNRLQMITGEVEIFDRKTEDKIRAKMWENQKYGLSPFDFIVYFPAELDYYRVSLLSQYLHKVRHRYTNFQTIAHHRQEEFYAPILDGDLWFDRLSIVGSDSYVMYQPETYFMFDDKESLLSVGDRLIMPRHFHIATNGLPVETTEDRFITDVESLSDEYEENWQDRIITLEDEL